jgi:ElaB/YqjD/DUF883 family membrane-anchored ribosome-binding protein
LEPHSQTDDTPQSRRILEGQLREAYGRVVYTHKTQEKCADILLRNQSWIRIAQIGLSALTTVGFITAVLGTSKLAAVVGLIVSAILLALNAYTKNYDPGEQAQKHRQTASDLWLVREKYQSLLVDLRMGEKPIEELQAQRDQRRDELHQIYRNAPSTNNGAYKRAQAALKLSEDMTFSDVEIDAFLPKELKHS